MSYTPGPWNLERDCNGVPEFVFGGDVCVCECGIEAPKPEDARRIAAAPELFEALRDIYAALVIEEISTETRTRARLRARDALALVRVGEGERR